MGAASVPSAPQPAIASPPSDYSAERRQISVMFCDLVDSTAMSARLDPEDHHEIIRAYQHTCAEIIAEFGGYVAQYLGDGIMVYFGFPRAHEDDPERAVLAALRITTAVANLRIRSDLRMSTRVGIATGLVVVGDRIAAGTGWEVGVVGETPNLAARLQGLAQPNTIVIGASTRRLLGHQFEYQDLGEHPLKGFDHPIHAWRVIEERAVDSRFKAVRSALMVPLVDRADERALLRDRGIRALNGQGQIVLLGGEPGIGKSRLARAAVEILCDESGAWLLEIQCSSFHTQSALFPVITALRHAIFPDGVPKEAGAGWTRLQEFFTEIGFTQEDALPLFANLLAIAAPSGQPPLAPAPERHKQLTLQYALELIERAAGNSPVLVLLEDLHWSDPTTLELVNLFVDRSRSRRMFGLFTTRPGFSAAWTNRPNVTALTLGRLANVDAIELVRHMSGLEPLAPEVVETVITKTDGIPLYLQEYTKTMVEFRQSDRTGGGRAAAVIPDTLHDLLLARLDRLGDAKLIAQLAAMLGREFSVTVLEAVWSGDRETLWDGINKLIEEDVIHFRDELLRERMLFRHALVQDAAYQSQLKSSRAQMHRRIAEVIEQQFPDSVSSEPESLASHFTAANLPLKAIPYWEQAGNRAIGLAAYSEASRHFQAALDLVARLPEEPGRHGLELGLQLQFGLSLSGSIGYSAPGVETAYQRARELCGLLGDTADLYPVLRGLINFYIVRGDLKTSLELSESCLRLADETGHPEYRVEACNAMGYTLGYMGSLRQGAAMLEEGIRTYLTSLGAKRSVPSPHDPLIGCSSFLLLALWLMGEGDRAVQCQQDLLEVLKQRDQPFDEAYASCYLAVFEAQRGNDGKAAEYAAQCLEIAERNGYPVWRTAADIHLAFATLRQSDPARGVERISEDLAVWRTLGAETFCTYYLAALAECCWRAGLISEGLAAVGEGLAHAEAHDENWYRAELYRLRGELRQSGDDEDVEAAEADFRTALDTARAQEARLLEVRAALSLFRLTLAQGRPEYTALEEAAARLAMPAYQGIPELREAESLLATPAMPYRPAPPPARIGA